MNRFRNLACGAMVALGAVIFHQTAIGETDAFRSFEIQADTLDKALARFSEQSGIQYLFTDPEIATIRTSGVRGHLTLADALDRILHNTGLEFEFVGSSIVRVYRAGLSESDPAANSYNGVEENGGVLHATQRTGAAVAAQSAPTRASESDDTARPARAGRIDEILVTAARREQSLQEIGQSISAFSGDELRRRGVDDIEGLVRQIPNFSMGSPAGEGTTPALSIRGVGVNTFSDNLEGTVAFYIDDIYYASLPGQAAKLFDLERVEVLRGPQGTLYGRNATAGLVHFITRPPTSEPEGYVDVGYGRFDQVRLEAAVGGPLSDGVSGRLSVFHDRDSGYMRDRVTGARVASKDITAVRGQLGFQLGDDLDVLLRAQGSRTRNISVLEYHRGLLDPTDFSPCSIDRVRARECVDLFGYRNPSLDPFSGDFHSGDSIPLDIDTAGGSVHLTWAATDWEFVSVSGYEYLDKMHVEAGYVAPVGTASAIGFDAFEYLKFTLNLRSEQWSQEFRASRSTDRTFMLLGAYYLSDDKSGALGIPSRFANPALASQDPYLNLFSQEARSAAVFAHIEQSLTESWSVKGGLRYSRERSQIGVDINMGDLFPTPDLVDSRRSRENFLSWDFGVDWKPRDELLVYGKLSRGHKSGGSNAGGIISIPQQIEPFSTERLTMLELGAKWFALDDRIAISAAAFGYDYQDLQVFTQSFIDNVPVDRIENAADARIHGIEIEALLRPTSFLEIQLAGSHLSTETRDFFSVVGIDDQGQEILQDLSGLDLTFSPKWSFSGAATVSAPIHTGTGSLQVSFNYMSRYFFDADNAPLNAGGDYTLWNARAAWENSSGNFEVSAEVQNLTNKLYFTEGFDLLAAQHLFVGRPRTWLVRASYRY